ncbi:phosphoenolpyruvate synthase [Clostridium sp.]|uniref:phosphoenolpyruvate synthase n=1 Tax=Clostridium sp. TaxID=1506 RepID=UPI002FCC758A
MKSKYTIFFDEIDKNHLPLVGGKGANLGEMTKTGFTVPFGFCVTTECYKEFIELNKLSDFISQIIKGATLDNVSPIGKEIRSKIIQCEIPVGVKQELVKSLNRIGSTNYYAVRSSATAEDLAFASFAGQQDTYLNIKGEESILESVKNCWASLFTDRAILYRIQNKIPHENVYMSVVIQKMVLPEISGIMFTADPITGHRGIVSIDASYGLGEALVSGLVSPDIYKFRKKTGSIDSKTIAQKKLAIIPLEDGGTKKIEISGKESSNQVMEDSQIKSLVEIGIAIEKHYGSPQDIEWCMEKGKIYIVQSRAITSLFPIPTPIPKDDALHGYVSFNHFQVMIHPISPLGIDMLRLIMSFDNGARSAEEYKILKSAAGRIYIDLSVLLQHKRVRNIVTSFMKNADALASEALVELTNRPDFEAQLVKNDASGKSLKKFIKPIAVKAIKNLAYKTPEGTIEFVNEYIKNRMKKTEEAINSSAHGIEKLEAIFKHSSFINDFQTILPKMAPAMISFKAVEGLEKKLLGTNKYSNLIVKGLEGNITTELGLLVGDMADHIRKSLDLTREFESNNYRTLIERINSLNGYLEFKRLFNDFMNKYDMRAAGEIDMAKDRWIENPEPLVKAIMATVKTSEEGIHRKDYKDTIETAKKAAQEFIMEVEAKHGKAKGIVVKRLIRVLRNYLPVREHPKYLIMKLILIFKKAFLEEAKILVQKGHLQAEKDIFYVSFWELYEAMKNNESLVHLVALRKEEYEHFKKLTPPRVITSEGEEIKAGYKIDNLPKGSLAGIPVSSGIIEGMARVITDPSSGSINKGEILVAPFTDPGWTPLFINAAGLVMEIGGLLTHGTVVAREYGMPAVVGITDATKIIKTGQKIRVDGNAGYVMIIEE